jgi:phosphotransferase system, enzyme I, PtsP
MAASQDIMSFLQRTVNLVSRHLKADVCSIYMFDENSGNLVLKATVGLNPEAVDKVRMKPGEGLVGTTFELHRPVRDASASCNPLFKYFVEADEDRFESFLAVPIQRGAQKIGVLAVQHERGDYFDERDTMALRAAASQLAGAIENARLLMDLFEATGKTPAAPPETLQFIKGKSASGGTAFAPITQFKKSHGALLSGSSKLCSLYTAADFHEALKQTSDQLMAFQTRLAERLPESASLIFTAHFMILKDAKFINKIVEHIENGMSPPDAVRVVARHYINLFSASSHAYIREKANDMEDLAGRILQNIYKHASEESLDGERVVIARELYPSEILKLATEEVKGIILVKGGVTSHVSILARSLKIPLVIADRPELLDLAEGTPVLLDGGIGNIYVRPADEVVEKFRTGDRVSKVAETARRKLRPISETRDGVRVRLLANVNLLSELKSVRELNAEGVGLYRTEFPFLVRPTFPSEEEQYFIYKRLLDEMEGREVTIRTLDVGGDKVLAYANAPGGNNPDLGLRSIRFSMHYRNLFEQQLRAILRAAAEAEKVRIMFPLISSLDEFREAKQVVLSCMADLKAEGLEHHPGPAIGMMVEVPAVVEIIESFTREADFLSIGTNDFVQYSLAVDRSNEKVAAYYRPDHPSILRALARIVEAPRKAGKDISVCGEMAHETDFTPFLLGIGVSTLSVDPQFLPMIQDEISSLDMTEAKKHAERLLAEDTLAGVREIMTKRADMSRHAASAVREERESNRGSAR